MAAPALEHTNVSKLVGRKQMKKILFVINDAAFFVSHRLPIALRLIKEGYDVHLACRGDNSPIYDEIGLTFHTLDIERKGVRPLRELRLVFQLYI